MKTSLAKAHRRQEKKEHLRRPALGSRWGTVLLSLLALFAPLRLGERCFSAERLAVIRPAPDFTLTTQAGETLKRSDLKGKVLLVSFIFTTCNGSCPATTHRMALVQQALKDRGLCKDDRVRLLSIT